MNDRPMALRSGVMIKQKDGDRFGQKWSDLDKSIRTVDSLCGRHREDDPEFMPCIHMSGCNNV